MENDKSVELLRERLKKLRKERDSIIFEKGMAAQDNKDLRENALYESLETKEHLYTSLILAALKEIERLTK